MAKLTIKDKDLYKELIALEVVPKGKLAEAFKESKRKSKSLYEVILDKDLIADENLGMLMADILELPFASLANTSIDKKVLQIIPEIVARKQGIIAFKKDAEGMHVAMYNPAEKQIVDLLKKKTGEEVKVYFATPRDVELAFAKYSKDIGSVLEDIIKESTSAAEKGSKADPSIIKITDMIINYAYQNKASDIHIEPNDDESLVRFRIDGVMHDVVELPISLHDQIITRIKVLSNLRTDEHNTPQDGKISHKMDLEKLDIRVSIVPITDGEKVVMRLLSEKSRRFSLSDLGFPDDDLKKVEIAYQQPHGMILATGPTGSGKTTTLYSILKLLNNRDVNIMTIEDPVEYDIDGINQIQVNTKTDLTFASGLRSIVRQDPDIILVGEIRDEETADISINAAMTGHLVLSTLHTNDAATTLPRLIDLKVEPFLIATTVNVIVAQRLVRKICLSCRMTGEVDKAKEKLVLQDKTYGTDISSEAIKLLDKYYGNDEKLRICYGKGCLVCHKTGYSGRVGIFEVLVVDEEVRSAIIGMKDAAAIREIAIKKGMRTIQQDGIEKVKLGVTTIEEVMRVTKE